jgi:hypothetical protein
MNRKRRKQRSWNALAILVTCLFVAIHASQGMVLCFGTHGHVAIEPAGHRHCDDAVHYHGHGADAEASHEKATGYVAQEHCDPCVDIPLSLGPLDERTGSSLPTTAVAVVIGEPSAASQNLPVPGIVSESALLPTHHTPLRGVVLQM